MSAANELVLASIRPMTEADIDDVVRVEQESYEFPWKESIFRDCLQVGYSCWVIEYPEKFVGYALLTAAVGEAHILNLCIAPGFRRFGLARLLLSHLDDVAKSYCAKKIFLEVRPTNQGAIQLYEDEGFIEVGMRKNYYPAKDGREDAIIMAKRLMTVK